MIPQDVEPAPPVRPYNRPPAIDLPAVTPSQAVVELNLQCPERLPPSGVFLAPIVELDTDQVLVARWFLDYAYPGTDLALQPIKVDDAIRADDESLYRYTELQPGLIAAQNPSIERPHTLEVFVVEQDALAPRSDTVPVWRALRDCAAEGHPEDCISSSPAVYRWTLDVKDEVCP